MLIGKYDEGKETLQHTFSKLIQKYISFEELDSFMLHELIEKITIYETPNIGTKNTVAKENYDLTTMVIIKLGDKMYNGEKGSRHKNVME